MNIRKQLSSHPKLYYIAAGLLLSFAAFFIIRSTVAAPESKSTDNSTAQAQTADPSTEQRTPDTQPIVVFNKSEQSITDPASKWIVVNKKRPLSPLSYAPTDLVNVGGGQSLRAEAADAFIRMKEAAAGSGLTLLPLSGYRSYQTQVSTYNGWVNTLGQEQADRESARAGYSEHQTGFAIDIGGGGCGIEPCFGTTTEGMWVAAHAYEYGFLLRYTQEKMPITGYQAEPWHFRYIGTKLATELKNQNIITLEEFFDLQAAPGY